MSAKLTQQHSRQPFHSDIADRRSHLRWDHHYHRATLIYLLAMVGTCSARAFRGRFSSFSKRCKIVLIAATRRTIPTTIPTTTIGGDGGRLASFDKLLMGGVVMGCVSLTATAYWDGIAPLQDSQRCTDMSTSRHGMQTSSYTPKRRLVLNDQQCRQLEHEGYLVVEHFLTPEEVKAAQSAIRWDLLKPPSAHADDETVVRTDRVYFRQNRNDNENDNAVEAEAGNKTNPTDGNGLQQLQTLLRSVGTSLVDSNFEGFHNNVDDAYAPRDLWAPSEMQVSFYDVGGTYYRVHTDGCGDSIFDMGVLGWLRSRYLRERYLTSIVYLNTGKAGRLEWDATHDGGCLRVFPHMNNGQLETPSFVDIEPKAGRLVLFSSTGVRHAVLPTFAPRLACCIWFTLQ